MRVRLLFFGMLKEVAGRERDNVDLPPDSRISDLLSRYAARVPAIQPYYDVMAVALNQEYSEPDAALHDNDEVALIPPVSGGKAERAKIVREKIEAEEIVAKIKQPADGAVAVFDGIVRDHSRDRRTLYLDYEAYEAMALKEMDDLAEQAIGRFKVRDVCLIHRLGRLQIGETSVLIVVASEHRGPAFDACRWLIDTLKKTVPIWKKEYFEDGAVWADGEPFPQAIRRAGSILPAASK